MFSIPNFGAAGDVEVVVFISGVVNVTSRSGGTVALSNPANPKMRTHKNIPN